MADNLNQIEGRLAVLKAKLRARKGKTAYKDNVPAIEAEIARLERLREHWEGDGA